MEPEDYLVELNTAQMTDVTGAPVYRDGGVGTGGVTEVNAFIDEFGMGPTTAAISDGAVSPGRMPASKNKNEEISTWAQMGSYALAAAPYVQIGLAVFSGITRAKAEKEAGRQRAADLRKQGESALRNAEREAKTVKLKQKFKKEQTVSDAMGTGLFSGEKSFKPGTGISSMLEANKNAAMELAKDIMTEGQAQKREFDEAADATEKASDKGTFGTLLGGAAQVIGQVSK